MTADLADFMFANMKGGGRGRNSLGPFRGYTGAVIRADRLYLATLKHDEAGRLRLQQEFTRSLRMPGRLQPAVRAFSAELTKFLRATGIRRILLRSTSDSRKYAACAEGYAIECVLKLIPTVVVEEVHRATLKAWPRQERYILPRPPLGPWKETECFEEAIEAAGLLESRCSPGASI